MRQRWWPRIHLIIVLGFVSALALGVGVAWHMLQRELARISAPSGHAKAPAGLDGPPQRSRAQLRFKARHFHTTGICRGELVVEPDAISFTSPDHSFRWTRREFELHEDGLQDDARHRWQLEIDGGNTRDILGRWMRREIDFGR